MATSGGYPVQQGTAVTTSGGYPVQQGTAVTTSGGYPIQQGAAVTTYNSTTSSFSAPAVQTGGYNALAAAPAYGTNVQSYGSGATNVTSYSSGGYGSAPSTQASLHRSMSMGDGAWSLEPINHEGAMYLLDRKTGMVYKDAREDEWPELVGKMGPDSRIQFKHKSTAGAWVVLVWFMRL